MVELDETTDGLKRRRWRRAGVRPISARRVYFVSLTFSIVQEKTARRFLRRLRRLYLEGGMPELQYEGQRLQNREYDQDKADWAINFQVCFPFPSFVALVVDADPFSSTEACLSSQGCPMAARRR
jgi:hypothetical protein